MNKANLKQIIRTELSTLLSESTNTLDRAYKVYSLSLTKFREIAIKLKDNKLQELEYTTISEDKLTEDTNLQKKLVRNYLKEKGFKDAKIEREVTRYEDLGDLETEAVVS